MKFTLTTILCATLTLCVAQEEIKESSTSAAVGSENSQELIRQCFSNYKSAILNDKGQEAVEYVDSRTLAYYQEILDKTIMADSTEVDQLNIMDKLMVFSIRHRTPKEDILKFDGKQLLVYAIQEGMVGKSSVANIEIGEIEFDSGFSKGQLVTGGTPTPIYFHFYKEEEEWKIDLTSLFPVATQAFQGMADESGQDENEYLFMLLEMITGDKPASGIWKTIEE